MSKELSFKERVASVQNELKAPKTEHNDFGNFFYRSAEGILEAVKPINAKYGLFLTLSDNVEVVGDRVYIKAIATLSDVNSDEYLVVTAFAREQLSKKGMDESQVTGATSSYARKYALNGLYLIDDMKDSDTNDQRNQINNQINNQQNTPAQQEIERLKGLLKQHNSDYNEQQLNNWLLNATGFNDVNAMYQQASNQIIQKLNGLLAKFSNNQNNNKVNWGN